MVDLCALVPPAAPALSTPDPLEHLHETTPFVPLPLKFVLQHHRLRELLHFPRRGAATASSSSTTAAAYRTRSLAPPLVLISRFPWAAYPS